ncbi:hypothetical protein GCM10010507_49100 [Streptomyces cinnamoneus]|uniref:PPE family domain-containing protein n=1 Tax=Streptomyces cinnamoneus TaxID=53446 RepID=A0A918TWZ8_STRCJ|nr:hypothetical protein GCM10010507_49100 [Streptomyces cinnamoneus]
MTTPPPPSGGVSPLIHRPSSGLFTTSDFESMTHEQLRAMVEHARPAETAQLGAKLTVAAVAITKLGEQLKEHMAAVKWESLGGDAFREWGADMANATLRLGEFSQNAGTWMTHAAETLSSVKSSMPAVSAASKTTLDSYRSNNPGQVGAVPPPSVTDQSGGLQKAGPSQKEAYAAQQRLDADRAEAAQLMRKLAESYAWSARNMAGAERPTFPPMPLGDPGNVDGWAYMGPTGGGGSQGVPAHGAGDRPAGSQIGGGGSAGYLPVTATDPSGVGARDGSRLSAGHYPRTVPASMEVDGGVAVPHIPVRPATEPAAPSPTNSVPGNSLPLPLAPGASPAEAIGRVTAGLGGTPSKVGPYRTGVPGAPGRGLVGGGIPAVPGVPTDGVVGGRPTPRMPGAVAPTQVPRGTVIGSEPGQGRAQMGYGGAHAVPPAGAAGSGRGSGVYGRRLATEPGGVVGGRGRQPAGTSGERVFTQGGSGLVRAPGGSSPSQERSASRQGQRPDYLTEDEETWSQVNRRVVPPVVD